MNVDTNIWYARLGQIDHDQTNRLAHEGLVGTFIKLELSICEYC